MDDQIVYLNSVRAAANTLEAIGWSNSFSTLCERFRAAGHRHIVGIGKSYLVAKRAAATFTSLDFPTTALHAVDVLHGDGACVRKDDMVIALSVSGATPEVIAAVEDLQKRINVERNLVVVTGVGAVSRLHMYAYAGNAFVIPCKSGEPYTVHGLPVVGSVVQAMFLDMIAAKVAWHVSRDSIRANHPGGALGKELGNG